MFPLHDFGSLIPATMTSPVKLSNTVILPSVPKHNVCITGPFRSEIEVTRRVQDIVHMVEKQCTYKKMWYEMEKRKQDSKAAAEHVRACAVLRARIERAREQEIDAPYETFTKDEISNAVDYCAQQPVENKKVPSVLWGTFKKLFS